jgi:hypothetical protein
MQCRRAAVGASKRPVTRPRCHRHRARQTRATDSFLRQAVSFRSAGRTIGADGCRAAERRPVRLSQTVPGCHCETADIGRRSLHPQMSSHLLEAEVVRATTCAKRADPGLRNRSDGELQTSTADQDHPVAMVRARECSSVPEHGRAIKRSYRLERSRPCTTRRQGPTYLAAGWISRRPANHLRE